MKQTVKPVRESWNENIEKCDGCGIKWKKIAKQCPVCYQWSEHDREMLHDARNQSREFENRRGE